MADPNLFIDPDSGDDDYVPCNSGVELHMSMAPDGPTYNGTATRVTAQGDAPDRVAITSGDAPLGYTLYKESHDEVPPSDFSSHLQTNFAFPDAGPISVRISCTKSDDGVTLVTVNRTVTPVS
jgi:hypothetical protein